MADRTKCRRYEAMIGIEIENAEDIASELAMTMWGDGSYDRRTEDLVDALLDSAEVLRGLFDRLREAEK